MILSRNYEANEALNSLQLKIGANLARGLPGVRAGGGRGARLGHSRQWQRRSIVPTVIGKLKSESYTDKNRSGPVSKKIRANLKK